MRATATTTVAASPERVWAVLADHEGMAAWGPGLKVSLLRHGPAEPGGVGAQRSIAMAPLLPPIVEEITAFQPEQRLSYRGVSGIPFRNYAGEVVLRPAGRGTAISYTVSADNRLPGVAAVLARGLLFALKRAVSR